MPTYVVARWATARMFGHVAGNAASNRFKRFRKPESKMQNIAYQTSALILAIVVATIVASATESAIDAVAPENWQN